MRAGRLKRESPPMGLDVSEFDFNGFGTLATGLPITFVKEPPLVTIAKIMFVDGFTPKRRFLSGFGVGAVAVDLASNDWVYVRHGRMITNWRR